MCNQIKTFAQQKSKFIQWVAAWVLISLWLGTQVMAYPVFIITRSGSHPGIRQSDPSTEESRSLLPTVSLEELIHEALENNPEIKVMQRGFDRMRARIPQAGALPDPKLTYRYMGNAAPIPPFDIQLRDPSSFRGLELMQEVPFPGKRALRQQIASSETETEWWAYEQTRLNVIADIKTTYFELWFVVKSQAIVQRNKDLLEKFVKITEARYTVGKGIQPDVFKAQVEVARLIDQLTVLDQRRQTLVAQLNSLLFRDPDSPLGEPAEIVHKDVSVSIDHLKQTALEHSPTIKAQKSKISREQHNVQLVRREFYPDFTVGFSYLNRPKIPEMYGISVGITLPIFLGRKQRPALAEAIAGAATEQKRLENVVTLLFFKLKDRILVATTASRLAQLYGKVIIPQSTLSFESALAGYEVGKVDFLTLLDNLVTLRTYELSYYEQVARCEKALAELEPLIGTEVSR